MERDSTQREIDAKRGPRPERVLVTGAAGFVGSTLCERLVHEGREVVGLDNFDPFYDRASKETNLRALQQSGAFRLIEGDIRTPSAWASTFESLRCDAVVHLAALAGVRPSLDRPADYADVNVTGTSALAAAALRNGVTRMVFASSSSVYGERSEGPFRESDPVERPISPYAATKRAGELVLHSLHHTGGLEVTCARIFTAYGPRQRPDLAIRKFAQRMLDDQPVPVYGDGSARRDFTFVDDLVDGLVRALDRVSGFRIVNLGGGRPVTVLEVVEALERALGRSARIDWQPHPAGDVSQTWADTAQAKAFLEYRPSVGLEDGIERFIAWLKDNQKGCV